MAKTRFVAGGLVVALLAMSAAPCFAIGPGEQAAMACCLANGHGSAESGRMAEACCRTGDATQHDRDVQPPTVLVKHVIQTSADRVHDFLASPSASHLGSSHERGALLAISPPRHTPLLI
jgi:hypothetical protein